MDRAADHRRDIQGLRGFSVFLVMLAHAAPTVAPGGYVGVDVFFVISGFLIARIIAGEAAEGRFRLLDFYERRIRRLLPAFLAMMAVTLAAGWLLLDPDRYAEFGRMAAASALFAANFEAHRGLGYFAGLSDLKPGLHLWTLSIEEQFYLVFPLTVLAGLRLFRDKLWVALAVVAMVSLAWSGREARVAPLDAYYLPASRAFEFLVGALLALAPAPAGQGPRRRAVAALTGLGLIGAAAALYDARTPFPGYAALAPCGGAALVIWAADRAGPAGRVLAFGPLVGLGTISYSAYLWHWPMLAMGRLWLGPAYGLPAVALILVAATAVAWASWRWIERPFMVVRGSRAATWLGAVAATVLVVVAGLAINRADGFPDRFGPEARTLLAAAKDSNPRRALCHNAGGAVWAHDRHCRFGAPGVAADLAVWGDSHGAELVVALGRRAAGQGRAVMQVTTSGCPPAPGYEGVGKVCAAVNATALEALVVDPAIRRVVLVSALGRHDEDALEPGYRRAVAALTGAGKSVALVLPVPTYRFDVPAWLALRRQAGRDPERALVAERLDAGAMGERRRFLRGLAAAYGAEVIDPAETLCARGSCRFHEPGVGVLYFDGYHLNVAGAGLVADAFADRVYGS